MHPAHDSVCTTCHKAVRIKWKLRCLHRQLKAASHSSCPCHAAKPRSKPITPRQCNAPSCRAGPYCHCRMHVHNHRCSCHSCDSRVPAHASAARALHAVPCRPRPHRAAESCSMPLPCPAEALCQLALQPAGMHTATLQQHGQPHQRWEAAPVLAARLSSHPPPACAWWLQLCCQHAPLPTPPASLGSGAAAPFPTANFPLLPSHCHLPHCSLPTATFPLLRSPLLPCCVWSWRQAGSRRWSMPARGQQPLPRRQGAQPPTTART